VTPQGTSPQDTLLGELRAARTSGARLPDFFIVGHAKCGTTALYRMLQEHPQVFLPHVKEPEFLSRAPFPAPTPGERPRVLPRTLEAYLALFAPAGAEQIAGEASTEYLRTPAAAERIFALNPDARIITMLREPASFLRSLQLQLLQIGVESERDLERAIALEPERLAGRRIPRGCEWPAALQYTSHVRYTEQLRGYRERFGVERVLTVIYDDFLQDNAAVVAEVLRFLGVGGAATIEPQRANPTFRVRSRAAERLINGLAVGSGPVASKVKRAIELATPQRLRRAAHRAALGVAIEREPPPPDELFMAALRRRFEPEVRAVGEYLGRDLAGLWGYDRLGGGQGSQAA
jgi:hypothetical protein